MENIILKRERKGAKHCDFKAEERLAVRPRLEFTPHAYPDHALPDTTNMRSRQAKYIQQKALECGEKVNTETKHFVSLPSIDAHSGDPLGCNACGFGQRIHPLVTQKITELVSSGITDTGEVKQHLHVCVTKAVPKELGIYPKSNNRAFHPTTVDIRNHIWTVKKALELSE